LGTALIVIVLYLGFAIAVGKMLKRNSRYYP